MRTPTIDKLRSIWLDWLPVNDFTPDENFFDLGGSSLAAVNMLIAAQDEFEADIDVDQFLENPSLGTLAHLIDSPM
jgi:acyl carrier protein